MTAQTETSRDDLIARNLAAVETHFHNETPETEATGAPATYLLHFGENYRHFHALVAARGADVPAERRGGNILGLRPGHVDVAAAVALVPGVRAAYERIARAAPGRRGPPRRPGPVS